MNINNMTQQERIQEIISIGSFCENEIEVFEENTVRHFKSWEYFLIVHFTNEELYYTGELELPENADFKHDTKKGRIYAWS